MNVSCMYFCMYVNLKLQIAADICVKIKPLFVSLMVHGGKKEGSIDPKIKFLIKSKDF